MAVHKRAHVQRSLIGMSASSNWHYRSVVAGA